MDPRGGFVFLPQRLRLQQQQQQQITQPFDFGSGSAASQPSPLQPASSRRNQPAGASCWAADQKTNKQSNLSYSSAIPVNLEGNMPCR
mmetsp:Transcript_17600/g.34620  ORF Transcript_17600/g.34620 Transcript_17600/m.34620 type:complete len:88 (-) Transcript_17600:196-459(-)